MRRPPSGWRTGQRWPRAVSTSSCGTRCTSANVIMMVGMPLALGSYWGLLCRHPRRAGAGLAHPRRGEDAQPGIGRIPRIHAAGALPIDAVRVVSGRRALRYRRGPNSAPALDRPWRRPGALRYALDRIRGVAKPPVTVTDPPADIVIDRDVEVPTRDGTVLRINVFRKDDARPAGRPEHPSLRQGQPADPAGQEVDLLAAIPRDTPAATGDLLRP